jgi:sugar O-acyltransferase (sialic acid O-acetyltransferase NeuD family)
MKERIVIYGCGDFALKVKKHFERDASAEIVAFTVHKAFQRMSEFEGVPVISYEDMVHSYDRANVKVFVSVGYSKMNRVRGEICQEVMNAGFLLAKYISPFARLWLGTELGQNVFIDDEVIVGPNCKIGDGVLFFMRCTLSHDIIVERNVFFAPAVVVGGNVTIGACSFLGINSTVKNGVVLAPYTLVGSAANIVDSTVSNGVYVGNPGKPLPNRCAEDTSV